MALSAFAGDRDLTLHLTREICGEHATLGQLFVDGEFQWWTLEDRLHDGPKVPGETCIPAGRYPVIMTLSTRFGKVMPLLVGVPGFAGIRIHGGNTDRDTLGCILVGGQATTSKGTDPTIAMCAPALAAVYQVIQRTIQNGFKVWIEIVNPPGVPKAPGSSVTMIA